MESTAGRLSGVRKVVSFLAIVWGVAATFIAFEVVSLRATDVMLAHPELFGRLMLSRATQESAACIVGPGERHSTAEGRTASGEGRVGAWLIGLSVGREAVARQLGGEDSTLSSLSAQRTQFATALGVPPPATFVPQNLADARREFVAFIEADPQGTAHQFAVKYAPESCQLYKLGTLWGYSMLVRPMLPGTRAVFVIEIHHYARLAALPRPLWQPMIEQTDPGSTREQLQSGTLALTNGVTAYLMEHSRAAPAQ